MVQVPSPLVDVAWLAEHAGDPDVRIVDCRWYLGGKRGADEYARAHVPGAVFADLDRDLAAPRGEGPGRHPLPTLSAFRATLSALGVSPGSIVVAYDDAGGAIASRLWWMLRGVGHAGARVLDGGFQAWCAGGLPIASGVERAAPAPPIELRVPEHVVDRAELDRLRREPTCIVLDARAPERYRGEVETIDPRAGHIPGVVNAPFVENLVAPGGRFRSRDELIARFRSLGALDRARVVCSCGSGVTACHDILALAIAGRDDVDLYVGSWSDWSSDPSLPIAVGGEPG